MKIIAAATVASALAASLFAAAPASAQEARIRVGDLNLAAAAGADGLDARIDNAARDLCRWVRRPGSRISDRAFCTTAVRAEVMRQLPARARYDYALARLPRVDI